MIDPSGMVPVIVKLCIFIPERLQDPYYPGWTKADGITVFYGRVNKGLNGSDCKLYRTFKIDSCQIGNANAVTEASLSKVYIAKRNKQTGLLDELPPEEPLHTIIDREITHSSKSCNSKVRISESATAHLGSIILPPILSHIQVGFWAENGKVRVSTYFKYRTAFPDFQIRATVGNKTVINEIAKTQFAYAAGGLAHHTEGPLWEGTGDAPTNCKRK